MVDIRQSEDGTFILSGLSEFQAITISTLLHFASGCGDIPQDEAWSVTVPIDEYFFGDEE